MSTRIQRPIALTIAGSDSGGGAGIQADLKTFAALGAHGTSVITCLTAQNPHEVLAIEPVSPGFIRQQLKAIFAELKPEAIKTGMLYSAEIITEVSRFLREKCYDKPLIVDPVLIATSGATLLKQEALSVLKRRLLPLATLMTPNLPEAETLIGRPIQDPEAMREAARALWKQFGCAVLLKGGHLSGTNSAVDIFYDGQKELLLTAPYVKGLHLHGTGCTYAAAIAAFCAKKIPLVKAVGKAKEYITQAIAASYFSGKHRNLGSL